MSFKVLSVFANAGLKTDDESYVVVELDADQKAREVYSTKQSELFDGHDAGTLLDAFTLAWDGVRAQRSRGCWQLQVKRHPEFDGGCSGWENGDRLYGAAEEVAEALEERRTRHALYLLAINPVYIKACAVKEALNKAAALPVAVVAAEPEVVYQEPPRQAVKVPLTVPVARL